MSSRFDHCRELGKTEASISLAKTPARTDLTDRECAKLIGGMLGGLTQMADVETVRAAVRWWAETDDVWKEFHAIRERLGL